MTLSEKQRRFTRAVAELIRYTYEELGYELTFGEVARTPEQQALYRTQGKSQTSRSQHLQRLAVDLNLFINGHYQQGVEAYRPLGVFWVGLDPEHHVWGGDWVTLRDAVHFEYKG